MARCNKEFVRVYAVGRVLTILAGFGIVAPQLDKTKKNRRIIEVGIESIAD